jgi:hypothetical protein
MGLVIGVLSGGKNLLRVVKATDEHGLQADYPFFIRFHPWLQLNAAMPH